MALKRLIVPYGQTLFRPADRRQKIWTAGGNEADPMFGMIGPQCCICNKTIPREQTVDEYRGPKGGWIEVRVFCHGAEDVARFDYASKEWDHHDVRRSMESHRWFDPTVVGETTSFSGSGT